MAYRYQVGRDLVLLRNDGAGVEVEGTTRLSPGRVVRLMGVPGAGAAGRPAVVLTWRITRLGRGGLVYRGYCEWIEAEGEAATPD